MRKLFLSLSFIFLALSADAALVTNTWDINVKQYRGINITVRRGETVDLFPKYLSGTDEVDLTGFTSSLFRYRPVNTNAYPWGMAGSIVGNGALFHWTSANCVTNEVVEYEILLISPSQTIIRGFGKIYLEGWDNFNDYDPPSPPNLVDWLTITNLNLYAAPFATTGFVNSASTTLGTSLTNLINTTSNSLLSDFQAMSNSLSLAISNEAAVRAAADTSISNGLSSLGNALGATNTILVGLINGVGAANIATSNALASANTATSNTLSATITSMGALSSAYTDAMGDRMIRRDGTSYFIPTNIANSVTGQIWYSESDEALNIQTKFPGVIQSLGQEVLVHVWNATGVTISNGVPVYVTGAHSAGELPTVAAAYINAEHHETVLGVATMDIPGHSEGMVCHRGIVRDIDTSAWSVSNTLYLTRSAGVMTNYPLEGSDNVRVGVVLRSRKNTGKIYVSSHHVSYHDADTSNYIASVLGSAAWSDSGDFATAAQGALADGAVQRIVTNAGTVYSILGNGTYSTRPEIGGPSTPYLEIWSRSLAGSWTMEGSGLLSSNMVGSIAYAAASDFTPSNRTVTINGETQELSSNVTFTVAASEVDPIWGAASNHVVYTNDTRLTDARVPLAHTQPLSSITNAGTAAYSNAEDFALSTHNQPYTTITNSPWLTNEVDTFETVAARSLPEIGFIGGVSAFIYNDNDNNRLTLHSGTKSSSSGASISLYATNAGALSGNVLINTTGSGYVRLGRSTSPYTSMYIYTNLVDFGGRTLSNGDGSVLSGVLKPSDTNGWTVTPHTGFLTNEPALTSQNLASLELTGWQDCDNITVNFTNSTIILTHASGLTNWWRGVAYGNGNAWTSSPCATSTGVYFLAFRDNGTNATWSTTPWTFDMGQVAAVTISSNYTLASREVHGFMEHDCHEEFHQNIGTFRVSGLTVGDYQLNANSTGQTVSVAAGVIQDEDLESSIAGTASGGPYTWLLFTGTGQTHFMTNRVSVGRKGTGDYGVANTLSGGNWTTNTEIAANRFVNYYMVHIPVCAGSLCQQYRTVILQPQVIYTSLTSAQAEDFRSLNLGDLGNYQAEFVPYARLTYDTANTYVLAPLKQRLQAVSYIEGSKATAVNVSGTLTPGVTSVANDNGNAGVASISAGTLTIGTNVLAVAASLTNGYAGTNWAYPIIGNPSNWVTASITNGLGSGGGTVTNVAIGTTTGVLQGAIAKLTPRVVTWSNPATTANVLTNNYAAPVTLASNLVMSSPFGTNSILVQTNGQLQVFSRDRTLAISVGTNGNIGLKGLPADSQALQVGSGGIWSSSANYLSGFFDTANSAYYVDPATVSTSIIVAGSVFIASNITIGGTATLSNLSVGGWATTNINDSVKDSITDLSGYVVGSTCTITRAMGRTVGITLASNTTFVVDWASFPTNRPAVFSMCINPSSYTVTWGANSFYTPAMYDSTGTNKLNGVQASKWNNVIWSKGCYFQKFTGSGRTDQ